MTRNHPPPPSRVKWSTPYFASVYKCYESGFAPKSYRGLCDKVRIYDCELAGKVFLTNPYMYLRVRLTSAILKNRNLKLSLHKRLKKSKLKFKEIEKSMYVARRAVSGTQTCAPDSFGASAANCSHDYLFIILSNYFRVLRKSTRR